MDSPSIEQRDHESLSARLLSSALASSYALIWGAVLVVFLYLIFFKPN